VGVGGTEVRVFHRGCGLRQQDIERPQTTDKEEDRRWEMAISLCNTMLDGGGVVRICLSLAESMPRDMSARWHFGPNATVN
jgi:hypothetical protein